MFRSNWKRNISMVATLVLLAGCASMNRSCSSSITQTFGGDWMITQVAMDGTPFNCWKLENISLTTDENGGGEIQWLDTETGHLMHVNGWHNQVQVANRDWAGAARELGVDADQCLHGRYPATAQ